MNTEIRRLKPEDAQAYRQLRLESLELHPLAFCSTLQDQSKKEQLAFELYIEAESKTHYINGLFAEDILIGICGIATAADKKEAELIQMYVKNEFKGKQLGTTLLKHTIHEVWKEQDAIEKIKLGVFESSAAAFKVYEKFGFEKIGIEKTDNEKRGKLIWMELKNKKEG